jgi:ABC-2 type transport system permease protein
MNRPAPSGRRAAPFSGRRVAAVILRHLYTYRRSWPRLLELTYWPMVQMILWGFITNFFVSHSTWVAQAAGVLISAVLLWDVLYRANLGLSVSFIEEMWSRNLGQLFISPLRPYEMVAALIAMSFIRTVLSVGPAALLAWPFYDVWIFAMGLPLLTFFVNLLVLGWAVGLFIAGLLVRFGLGVESLCWLGIFLLAPLSGVYYPVAALPAWLQPISWSLPSAYVFEGMRAVLFEHVFDPGLLIRAVALNAVYLAAGAAFFLWMFRQARVHGLLLQQGE